MATIQKFYFHDAASGVVGTLPSASTQAQIVTPAVTATGAGTNRSMDDTAGVSQVSVAATSLATTGTPDPIWFRRFVSPPLAAQTIASGAWTLSGAGSESSTNSNFQFNFGSLYAWRPGTGAIVGSWVFDRTTQSDALTEFGTTQTALAPVLSAGVVSSVTLQGGDVLVYELWGDHTSFGQGMATAYTNTLFYDGTTEASTTSCAAFLNAPAAIKLYDPPPPNVTVARTRT